MWWFHLALFTRQSRARAAGKKHPKKRGQRATSNIFAMFDQAQIQEFKEVKWSASIAVSCNQPHIEIRLWHPSPPVHTLPQAFNMIDQNRDGFIDNEDLKDMLASLGEFP